MKFTAVFPVITFIVGQLMTLYIESHREKSLRHREKLRWRAEFQRDTLLQLHSAAADLNKLSQAALHERQIALEASGVFPPWTPVTGTFNQEVDARLRTSTLRERVQDDVTRDLVEGFLDLTHRMNHEADENEASAAQSAMIGTYQRLESKVGEELRYLL